MPAPELAATRREAGVLHSSAGRFISRLTNECMAVVLAGGRGTRLAELTRRRSKPAVPFGGKFRIVDFTLSNCINSGIRRIALLTQYQPYSLIRHMQRGWGFLHGEVGEFIELFPASQNPDNANWYEGTADAVYQNLETLRYHDPGLVLVLAGDHVYKMDYGPMLAHHVEQCADMTVGCIEVPLAEASAYGVMKVDDDGRVVRFEEKPEHPAPLPGAPDVALVSMGIYVFRAQFLFEQLERDAHEPGSSHDFGKDILPLLVDAAHVVAYPFRDMKKGRAAYWRDVGTLDAYWRANIELVHVVPELDLYDRAWPVWTYQEQLPPAKFVFDDDGHRGMAVDSMVSGGCIVSGGLVRRSVLFSDVHVGSRATIEESVVLPSATVGEGCRIRGAIIDEGCTLAPGTVIGHEADADARRFRISPSGIVLVTSEMLDQAPVMPG